ncbi:hypothetical protein GGTG_08905 [Gaeumannomyces tritici R3-111a-1]|uniref:F-box domain-containing protein n=1 Tax=Gaeumannomyces tritici (strain R3-111a-1) TaxID=644352 RepID=J3P5W5_GAET3|nr:hypothetical protein GGTG_08905 [Gaeumannomyces tritici R3-111a-1]EJT75067.1 hypothetical protein GGTG_08905 [Gaeumannomyces tritici R3-111a-1]
MSPHTIDFLSLPPEIRNAIYVLVLLSTERLIPDRSRTQFPAWPFYHREAPARPPRASRLALLVTCRTIHAEASPLFYGNVIFELVDPRSPRWTLPWLRTIGANAAAVRFLAVLELRRTTAADGAAVVDDGLLGGLLGGLRGRWPRLRVVRLLGLPPGQEEMLRVVSRRVGCRVQAASWRDGVLEVELEVEHDGEEEEEEEPKRWVHDVVIRHLLRPIRPF